MLSGLLLCVGCSEGKIAEPQAGVAADKKSPITIGNVAVIDLDRVAHLLGQDKRITQALTAQQTKFQQQLRQLAESYREQLSKQNQSADAVPAGQGAASGAVQLASYQAQANTKLNQAQQQAGQKLALRKSELIKQFRDSIKPYAREAARKRGLSVIMTHNDSVIYDYAASVDITQDVVDSIARHQQTARKLSAAETQQR